MSRIETPIITTLEGWISGQVKDHHLETSSIHIPDGISYINAQGKTYASQLELVASMDKEQPLVMGPIKRVLNFKFGKPHEISSKRLDYVVTCLTGDGRLFADTGYIWHKEDGFKGQRVFQFLEKRGYGAMADKVALAYMRTGHARVTRFLDQAYLDKS